MIEDRVDRRLAAIFAGDIAGYSRLMIADEEGTLRQLKAHRKELIDPKIADRRGRIVKTTGDGMLVEFGSVVDAVQCAVEIQRGMAERNAEVEAERRIQFRIGINVGDIISDGNDIYGDGVNVAARLENLAEPGGVYISGMAYDQVRDKLDFGFEDKGEQTVKNMARPIRVFRVGKERTPPQTVSTNSARALWRWKIPAAVLLTIAILIAVGTWWLSSNIKIDRNQAVLSTPGSPLSPSAVRLRVAGRTPIAVLPFVNMSGDSKEEYFSDGLTEDIIDGLGRYSGLSVIAHSAVVQFKAKSEAPAAIARTLGVRYLVSGSVRRTDKRVLVLVRLSNAEEARLVWTQQFDEALGDVFSMQDQIKRRIVGALEIRLNKAEQERISKKATDNLEAYDLVLRGRALLANEGRRANVEARDMFQRAIEADPRYSEAHVELGRSYRYAVDQGWTINPHETLARAETEARKAIELDDGNSRAYALLGQIMVIRQQFDLAKSAAGRALHLNPSDPDGYFSLGTVLLYSGQIDQAIEALETARAYTTPARDEYSTFSLSLAYYVAERYLDCVQFIEGVIGRDTRHKFTYFVLAIAYAQLGNIKEAHRVALIAQKQNPIFDPNIFGSLLRDAAHQAKVREGLRKAGIE